MADRQRADLIDGDDWFLGQCLPIEVEDGYAIRGHRVLELQTEHTGDCGEGVTDRVQLSEAQARRLQSILTAWLEGAPWPG